MNEVMATLEVSIFDFLNQLKENNNREWFQDHKEDYQREHEIVVRFADELLYKMQQHDELETVSGKKSLQRIYRDIRFSKNKTPYKTNWSGGFRRATEYLRGGYYYHLEPGNSFVAGGFWGPNSDDLKLIREHLSENAQPLRDIVASSSFKSTFGELLGEKLKTAPKGYPKDHKEIDLLRYKQFIVRHNFTDEQVMSEGFAEVMSATFMEMRTFFDFMSEILTTDLNGESLI